MNPDDSDEKVKKTLTSYTAAWVKVVASYFGVTPRIINRCLSDMYGPVGHADLTLLYLRLAYLLTAMADGQISGTSKEGDDFQPFYRDLDLDHEKTVRQEIRAFNTVLAKYMAGRYKVSTSKINRELHRDYGPVEQADTGQLFTRAAAMLRQCTTMETNQEIAPIMRKNARSGHDHSPEWWDTHKVYTDRVKRAADLYSLGVSTVNSEMYKRRGSIHSESDHGIVERLAELDRIYPQTFQGDPR